MQIKPINEGNNKFCGPAVLSAIAGITTDEAEKLINSVRNVKEDRKVTGVYNHELNASFEKLGYKVYHLPSTHGRSIYFLMMNISSPGIYLFYVHGHVVAIEIETSGKRYLIDNNTKSPLNLSSSARLGQKVIGVVKLEKVL